jgi:transcription elongation factor Elf1
LPEFMQRFAQLVSSFTAAEPVVRVLDPADAYCPNCGHNRDTSSVSSIDEGDGLKSCQKCGTWWLETPG